MGGRGTRWPFWRGSCSTRAHRTGAAGRALRRDRPAHPGARSQGPRQPAGTAPGNWARAPGTFDSIARVAVGVVWLVYILIVEEYLRSSIGDARAQRIRAASAGCGRQPDRLQPDWPADIGAPDARRRGVLRPLSSSFIWCCSRLWALPGVTCRPSGSDGKHRPSLAS